MPSGKEHIDKLLEEFNVSYKWWKITIGVIFDILQEHWKYFMKHTILNNYCILNIRN